MMETRTTFYPPQRVGILFQILLILLLTAFAVYGLVQTIYASIGPMLIVYLFPSFVAGFFVPILAYRIYALRSAAYTLEREGVHLRWGLRVEDIPIDHIQWVHTAEELTVPLPFPRLRWPGSLVGVRRTGEKVDVEYMASTSSGLVLIGTVDGIYAISPANPQNFLNTFTQVMEMGSLAPIPARSVYPTVLMRRVWNSLPARWLILGGGLFSLVLLVWTSLVIPTHEQIFFGFAPADLAAAPVPSSRLLLLPILSSSFFLVDFLMGLFFFRREESQPLSFLLWGAGALLPLLFLIGVLAISGNQPV